MPDLVFALPGDPATLTGGYAYDRRLKAELHALGWQIEWLRLAASFPFPAETDLAEAIDAIAAVPETSVLLIDGLLYGVLPADGLARLRAPVAALVHHPLALETGLSPHEADRLARSERAALARARAVIATSGSTADMLASHYKIAPSAITVAEPGTDRSPCRRRGPVASPVRLLSVGTVTPRKGHDLLVDALAGLRDLDWQCRIVGSLERAPRHADAVRRMIEGRDLQGRIDLAGEAGPDELGRLYREADCFVLASLHEGYGMAFAEAMAHGLPVLGFAAGAVPSVVPEEAGLLVPPGDVPALRRALHLLIRDGSLRQRLSEGAARAAERLPRWPDAARKVDRVLRALA